MRVFDGSDLTGGTQLFPQFFAYDTTMNAGVRVAAADVDGDGTPDIITGPGKNFAPVVKGFDGTNLPKIAEFHTFDPAFLGACS